MNPSRFSNRSVFVIIATTCLACSSGGSSGGGGTSTTDANEADGTLFDVQDTQGEQDAQDAQDGEGAEDAEDASGDHGDGGSNGDTGDLGEGDAVPDTGADLRPDADVGADPIIDSDRDRGDTRSDIDASADGLLSGPSGGLAIDTIPDLDPPPHPEDGWLDFDGVPLSGVRLVAVVDPEATIGQVNGVLRDSGAEIVGGSPVAEYLIIDVSFDDEGQNMARAFTLLGESDRFWAVGVDQPSESLSLAQHAVDQDGYTIYEGCDLVEFPGSHTRWEWRSPDGGAGWGLKAGRVPFAWNLRDRMVRVDDYAEVAIVDDGFWLEHEDVAWRPGTPDDVASGYHGTGVASIIASLWEDSGGIEGVLPVDPVFLNMTVRGYAAVGTEIAELRQLERVIRDSDVRVLNYSKGRNFFFSYETGDAGLEFVSQVMPTDRRITWAIEDRDVFYTPRSFADGMGTVFDRIIDNLARKSRDDFLITCAAGNNGLIDATFRDRFREADRDRIQLTTYLARDTSACTNAAVVHANPHLLAVEALGPPGDGLARLSQRSGNIAAPGVCVGMATRPGVTSGGLRLGDYITSGGSSFAAPFVAGVATLLWTLEPDLSVADLRTALLSSAREGAGGSSPRVDAFAAARYLDTLAGNTEIQRALADIDDGTIDGMTRVTLGGVPDRISHHADGGVLGDGCVDMRDFRALRDAMIEAASPGTETLDGDADHPKRDLNQDGYLHHDTIPQLNDAAIDEEHWSRFDLNGDMRIDGGDVREMMAVWGQCRSDDLDPHLEGVNANSLPGLLSSADIWVQVPADNPSTVSVTGATTRVVDPSTATDLVDGHLLVTAPVACSTIEVCVRERDDSPSRLCQVISDVAAGNDIQVNPTAPAGDPSDRLVFHTDGALAGGGDFTAPGVSVTSPPDFDSINTHLMWGYRPALRSPDGRYIANEAEQMRCLDERSGFVVGNYCVSFINLADGDNTVMHLGGGFDPPTHTHLEAWQFSGDGSEMLVRGSPAFGDSNPLLYHFTATNGNWEEGWRWWRLAFEVDKNPNDNPAMSADGWVYFAGADGDIHRIQPHPIHDLDYFIDDFAFDVCPETSPVAEQLTSSPTLDTIAQVMPSPISVEGDVILAVRDGDDWHIDIMNAGGTERTRVVEYFEGRPAYNIVWAPTGRRIAYTGGGWTRTIELGPHGLPAESDIIVSNLGFYTGNLSWARDGSYLIVYEQGAYTLTHYTNDPSTCGTDPRTLDGFDDLGLVLVVDPIDGDVISLQCNADGQGFPTWAADSSYIALVQQFTDTVGDEEISHYDIVTVAIPTGTKDRITETMTDDLSGVRNDQYDPAWGVSTIP